MLDAPSSEVVWRVLATLSIRQFPIHFPSRASPCAITFQMDSTEDYVVAAAILSELKNRRQVTYRKVENCEIRNTWPQGFRAKDCGLVITYLPNYIASYLTRSWTSRNSDTKGVQETNGADVIGLVFTVINDTVFSLINSGRMCWTIRVARMEKCASKGNFSPKSKLLELSENEV